MSSEVEPAGTAKRESLPDGLPVPRRYVAMLAIAIGITMAVLDGTVVNVALPSISRELGATPSAALWIVNAYQLAIVVTLLPLAAVGERFGYRRVYLIGVVVFTIGSVACALADSLSTLVAARVLQGLGGSAIMSMNGALVRHTYPAAMLGRGIGLNGLVVAIAAAVAPSLAAGILAVGSWPWLFAINIPAGILNVWLGFRSLPEAETARRPIDIPGAVLSAAMFGLFFTGADALARGGGALPAAALVAAIVTGALLLRRSRLAPAPLLPLDLLRIPVFALSVGASICAFVAFIITFVALPFYFENALGYDQVKTGLLMTPWPVALGLSAPVAGYLSDRIPASALGAGGMALVALGLALLALLPAEASPFDIAWRMALCGFGFGFFQAPNNRTILSSAPRARSGAAGGMLAMARLLGMTLGAMLTAIAFHFAPERAETISLVIAIGFALAAGVASKARRM